MISNLLLSLQTFARTFGVECLVALAVTVTFLYYKKYQAPKNGIPLPPGPPAKWFWENVFPSVNIARFLADLVTEYGPVVTLRRGSHVTVIIGRVDAANEIMEKEGNALADRPRTVALGELLSNNLRLSQLRVGERLRRFRRAVHTHLQPKAVRTYQDMQLEHSKNLIADILDDPKNHGAHAQRYAASIILRLAYGKSTPTSNDDPEVVRIRQVMLNIKHAARPGAYLVDRIPWLKHIPGYGRELRRHHEFEMQLYRDQMDRVQSEMETNQGGNSFMRSLLEHPDEHGLSKVEMAHLAGTLFGAGSETTAAAITNMILVAACHPEAQRRVQEELDVVVGKDRMPTFGDSDSLPQVRAYVLETLRWRPPAPFGAPHRATEDIIWRGYLIPAGATVMGLHWAISQDPVVFPEPNKFDPQRWIDNNGRFRNNMTSYPYGFGRRVCPGQHLANKSLYMNVALLLWSFRIVERPDAPIDANDYTDAVLSVPAPFYVEFIPRIAEDRLKEMMSESAM